MLHITESILENILGLHSPRTLLIENGQPVAITQISCPKPKKRSSRSKRSANLVFSDHLTDMLTIKMSNIPAKEEREFIKWKLNTDYGIDHQQYHIGYKRGKENTYIWIIDQQLITAVYRHLEQEKLSPYKIYNQSTFLLSKILKKEKRYTGLFVLLCNRCWTISAIKNNELTLFRSFATKNPLDDESDIMEDLNDTFSHYQYHRDQIKAFYHPSMIDIPEQFLSLEWINADLYYD